MPRQRSSSTAPLQDRPAVVELEHCSKHAEIIEPGLVVQPRERRVADVKHLARQSRRAPSRQVRRPDLIGLRPTGDLQPVAPSRRTRKMV